MKQENAVALVLIVAVAGGGGWYWWRHHTHPLPQLEIAVGTPLDNQSHSRIDVIEEAQPLPSHTASHALIGAPGHLAVPSAGVAPSKAPPAAPAALVPAGDSPRLGVTLAMLAQSYSVGGPMARQMANAAWLQATQPDLKSALQTLRDYTPREGPMTVAALLIEAGRVLDLGAPANLPESTPGRETSWFRRQVGRLIHIQAEGSQTRDAWGEALRVARLEIARGNLPDARLTLAAVPLRGDARLDGLRGEVDQYLDQTGKLFNVLNAYTRVELK
jgi:hypothetical protein